MDRKPVQSANKCAMSSARLPTKFGARSRQARRSHLKPTLQQNRFISQSRHSPRGAIFSAPRAAQISNELVQTRLLLFAESGNVIPAPFLAILVLWLVIIFASFSLFSALNVTVFTCLSLF